MKKNREPDKFIGKITGTTINVTYNSLDDKESRGSVYMTAMSTEPERYGYGVTQEDTAIEITLDGLNEQNLKLAERAYVYNLDVTVTATYSNYYGARDELVYIADNSSFKVIE